MLVLVLLVLILFGFDSFCGVDLLYVWCLLCLLNCLRVVLFAVCRFAVWFCECFVCFDNCLIGLCWCLDLLVLYLLLCYVLRLCLLGIGYLVFGCLFWCGICNSVGDILAVH